MATTAFVSSGLEFVPNNYAAPLNTVNAPEAFHIIQDFLAQSAIGRALVEPEKLYGSQIKAFWETGVYDDGGDSGTPSIVFEFQETKFVITPGTVREAMGFAESDAYTISVGDTDLQRMMQAIGYTGSLAKIGQLKRPLLRKEWSFFFDCITRAFGKKCTNWDAIPIDSLQIGYSLLFDSNYDFARLVLMNIGEKLTENRHVVYFSRFCQILFSACVPNVENDEEDVIPSFKLHKRVFSDLTNKDLKKPSEPVNAEASTVQPRTGGRTKHVGTKPARIAKPATEVGISKSSVPNSVGTSKKRRANRSRADNVEAAVLVKRRKFVANYLFDDLDEAELQEDSNVVIQEAANEATMSTEDRANIEETFEAPEAGNQEIAVEAPEIIVQEATENVEAASMPDLANAEAEAEIFEPQGFDMEVEAHNSVNSEHIEDFDETEGVEDDQATVVLEESMATNTEILSVTHQVLEKGEEVDQTLNTDATENVATHTTENVPEIIAEIPVQEAVAKNDENVAKNTANSDNSEGAQDDAEEDVPDSSNVDSFANFVDHSARVAAQRATDAHFQEMYFSNWSNKDTIFSDERAADFVTKSSKEITNPELLTHLKATIIQVKSLNNRFDASDKVIDGLRNDIAARELTQQKDKSLYISLCQDQKIFDSRLSKVEENQVKMSTKLDEIANSIELLTLVLLSDDVKKGERVPQDKCKSSQTLTRKDDTTDGGAKGKHPRTRNVQRQGRRSNSDAQTNADGKRLYTEGQSSSRVRSLLTEGQSSSRVRSLLLSSKSPVTDEEVATQLFLAEHGKDVTIEDIQAEEQLLAEEHRKDVEAGIYKQKVIKAPRRKERGIVIKENVNSDQSLQYSRRPIGSNSDKGKGMMIEEPNLEKKNYSTSDKAQVDVIVKDMPTSDNAQVVQTQLSSPLQGFKRSSLSETLKPSQVNFLQTRTVLGKQSYDKSGLGSHTEKRVNNSPLDHTSLAEPGVGVTQENLDKLESVQMIYHRGLKKEFLLYLWLMAEFTELEKMIFV
ncbi:hypothetical protein POM88_040236 [Heracleum sosnowskyi]|uniref:Uncharacterized protein n=1 Tax=Heracleum sosnowskyi TaxID=360622 RepID=A0AAD8HEL9_9APIA|nr:hypothetical protein POM88_040236 [Heracleum sosnowskyi]